MSIRIGCLDRHINAHIKKCHVYYGWAPLNALYPLLLTWLPCYFIPVIKRKKKIRIVVSLVPKEFDKRIGNISMKPYNLCFRFSYLFIYFISTFDNSIWTSSGCVCLGRFANNLRQGYPSLGSGKIVWWLWRPPWSAGRVFGPRRVRDIFLRTSRAGTQEDGRRDLKPRRWSRDLKFSSPQCGCTFWRSQFVFLVTGASWSMMTSDEGHAIW